MLPAVNDEGLLEVLKDYAKAKTSCKEWHDEIDTSRNWYNFQHYVTRGRAKPGEERFNDPTPTNVVDLAVGIILAHPLEWKAYGLTNSLVSQEESSRIEKYVAGTFEANSEREEYNIEYETALHLARDGSAVLYTAWDPILAEEYDMGARPIPDKKSPEGIRMVQHYHETPNRLQVIDPKKTYWLKGGPRRWGQVFRVERMTVKEVEDLYGLQLRNYMHLDDKQKRETEGELIDHWRWEKRPVSLGFNHVLGSEEFREEWMVLKCLLFDNEFIWDLQETNYDDLPYSVQFWKPLNRDVPKEWTASAIQPLQETVTSLENAINRRARQINLLSSLPIVTKAMPGRNFKFDAVLGTHVPMGLDEDIAFPKWPGNPPDVSDHIDFLRGRLQQTGFTESAFGDSASAVSGYSLSQQTDQNRIRLEQPVKHLEILFSTVAGKIMRLSAKFAPDASIRVYGSMKGRDFVESIVTPDMADYKIKCRLKPEFPGEQTRKSAIASQARGTLSQSTIMERYYDIQQPDDEMDKIIMDMARMHPAVVQYGIMRNMKELADAGDEVAEVVYEQLTQSGIQGQQGAAPPNPEQLQGGPSPTGQPTPQEQGGQPAGQGEASFMDQLKSALPGLG